MWRWWALVVLVVLGLLVAAVIPFGSSGVRDVAAQFQAPADATTREQLTSPRRLVCLGADPCPSLFHSWTVPRRLDPSEFAGLVSAAGWTLPVEGDCSPRPNSFGLVGLCSAVGEVDGYAVAVMQLGESDTEATVLTLSVRPPR